MATGNEKLILDITAKDDASKTVDGLQKKVDKLESGETTVEVDADTKEAEKGLQSVAKAADKLDSQTTTVEVEGNFRQVLTALDDVAAEVKRTKAVADTLGQALGPELAAQADTVRVVGELQRLGLTLEDIEGNADELAAKMRELADADVGGPLGGSLGTARGKLDEMAGSARGANSALANMIGNTTQDVAGLGGVVGSLGVGLGQMGEYAADAALDGEKLGSALLSMAKVAGPMAALAAATYLVSNGMSAAAKKEEVYRSQVEALTKALLEGKSASEGLTDALVEAGKIEGPDFGSFGQELLGLKDGTQDYLHTVVAAGLTLDEFTAIVQGGTPAITAWSEEQVAAGKNANDLLDVMRVLQQAVDAQAAADQSAADKTAFFGDKLKETKDSSDDLSESTGKLQGSIDGAASAAQRAQRAQKDLDAATRGAQRAIDAQTASFDALKASVSDDQAWIDFQNTMVDVRQKGEEAMQAVADKTADADQKMRDYQTSVNTAKQNVIDLGNQLGLSIPEVKSMLLQIDDGAIDVVEGRLKTLTRNRTISLSIIAKGGAGYGGRTGDPEAGIVGAEGAIVNRPTIAEIGEAGPEAVIPLDKVPGNQSVDSLARSLGGGGGVTLNVYNPQVRSDDDLRRLLNDMAWKLKAGRR